MKVIYYSYPSAKYVGDSDFPSKKAAEREERGRRKSDVSRVFVRATLIVSLTTIIATMHRTDGRKRKTRNANSTEQLLNVAEEKKKK